MNTDKIPDVFIKLIGRSKDLGDGWKNVSDTLTPFVKIEVAKNPELFELSEVEGKWRVRLTERGKILSDYI